MMKNMRTQKLSVDLMQKTFDKNNPLEITQGDTGNEILLSINANGRKFILDNLTVAIAMLLPNGEKIIDHIPSLYYTGNMIQWKPRKIVTENSGIVQCTARIYDALGDRITTEYFEIYIIPQIQVLDDMDFQDSILDRVEQVEKEVLEHKENTYTKEETPGAVMSTLKINGIEVEDEDIRFKKNIVVEKDFTQE